MKKLVIYIHDREGLPSEAEHYVKLFPEADVIGFDYKAQYPWDAKEEFSQFFDDIISGYDSVSIIANSLGAYFSLLALNEKPIAQAVFISPVVDMEQLIMNMMVWGNVTETELEEKGKIVTSFGEELSWEYLCYVRNNHIQWHIPTKIIYGEYDNLTSIETITDFSQRTKAKLYVMEGGEHWFHSEEQMKFIDEVIL